MGKIIFMTDVLNIFLGGQEAEEQTIFGCSHSSLADWVMTTCNCLTALFVILAIFILWKRKSLRKRIISHLMPLP